MVTNLTSENGLLKDCWKVMVRNGARSVGQSTGIALSHSTGNPQKEQKTKGEQERSNEGEIDEDQSSLLSK